MDTLIGLEEQVKSIRSVFGLFEKRDTLKANFNFDFVQGIKIRGPLGTCKSTFIKIFVEEIQQTDSKISVFWKNKFEGYYGHEKLEELNKLFEDAKRAVPAILILDDVEKICPTNNYDDSLAEILALNLSQIINQPIFVICIFNIGPEEHFGPQIYAHPVFVRTLHFTPPKGTADRFSLLKTLVQFWTFPPTDQEIQIIAERTEGFSYVDLKFLCRIVMLSCLESQGSIDQLDIIPMMKWEEFLTNPTKTDRISEDGDLETVVGGLTEQLHCIKKLIKSFIHQEAFKKIWGQEPPKGILFYGPPGTGKTLLANCIVCEMKKQRFEMRILMTKGSGLFGKYVGDTQKRIAELFAKAHERNPTLIFLDEVDALCPDRTGNLSSSSHDTSAVCALLGEMDSVKRGEVLVVGATNRICAIDPAFLRSGRFDKKIEFTLPNAREREEILKVHTRKWKQPPTEDILAHVVSQTDGKTGADLENYCRQVFEIAFERNEKLFTSLSDKNSQLNDEDETLLKIQKLEIEDILHKMDVNLLDWKAVLGTDC